MTPQAPLSPELERALAYPQLTPLLATEFSHTDIRRSGAAGGNTRLSANVAPQGEAAYYAVLLGLAESNSDHLYAAIDASAQPLPPRVFDRDRLSYGRPAGFRPYYLRAARRRIGNRQFQYPGGWDSSYQMVNVFTLFFLYLISGNEADRQATILQSLEAGWQWMSPRIDRTSGTIDDAGNTRTANDPAHSPEGKGIKYFDASLGLVYLFALELAGAQGAADAVVDCLMSS